MSKYNNKHEIKGGFERYKRNYWVYKGRPAYRRSEHRQWDYIICKVCTGCGSRLSRYDNVKGYAFCFSCREILFPETVIYQESRGYWSPYPDSRWHALQKLRLPKPVNTPLRVNQSKEVRLVILVATILHYYTYAIAWGCTYHVSPNTE